MRTLFLFILFLLPTLSISQNVHESLRFDIKFGFIKGDEVFFKLSDTTYQDNEVQYYHNRDSVYSHETGWHKLCPGYAMFRHCFTTSDTLEYLTH
jgi:hypothetical protein